jgi:hypothetical protein
MSQRACPHYLLFHFFHFRLTFESIKELGMLWMFGLQKWRITSMPPRLGDTRSWNAQSYLKGYTPTWWKTMKQKERKNHGYTWEFFKEGIELEFIPKNSNYISRCKLHDLVNATNDNLHQYVRAYSEFNLEIQHMHELDCVCHFVMRLLTWAKRKFEENWLTSLFEAIMKVEGFLDMGHGEKSKFKKENKFLHKKAHHEGEWN